MSNTADVPASGDWLVYPGRGVVGKSGDSLPADGEVGYAHGCLFQLTNGTGTTDALYVNIGDEDSANFDVVDPSGTATGLKEFAIPLTEFRVHDAIMTSLPATAANDDLGITTGTYGLAAPIMTSNDFGGTTTTMYGRVQVPVPHNYVDGEAVTIVVNAHMPVAVAAGGTPIATITVTCFRALLVPENVMTTGSTAQSINSLTAADYTYTLAATDNIVAGDVLDIRIQFNGTDTTNVLDTRAAINSVTVNFTVQN